MTIDISLLLFVLTAVYCAIELVRMVTALILLDATYHKAIKMADDAFKQIGQNDIEELFINGPWKLIRD